MKLEWDFSELVEFADNLVKSDLEETFKRITKEISKILLNDIKGLTPRDQTGQLINGWNGNAFLVKSVPNGYEVEIVNKTEYAAWVNDGHKAYNQFGGPYPIHTRVKVISAHQWQQGNPTYHVFGHFFVERGILQLNNTTRVEDIIMKELQKWWASV